MELHHSAESGLLHRAASNPVTTVEEDNVVGVIYLTITNIEKLADADILQMSSIMYQHRLLRDPAHVNLRSKGFGKIK
jgi:hypothetical protein